MCMQWPEGDNAGASWSIPIDDDPSPMSATTATKAGIPIGRHVEVADDVGARLAEVVKEAAAKAIADRGHFAIAVAGGSLVKVRPGSARVPDGVSL